MPETVAELAIRILGVFTVERGGTALPATAWGRRGAARALVKLLAAQPEHRLHREQVLELLWPEVDVESAINSFNKALHAARRALEPDLPPRRASAYLPLADDMLWLETEHIWIDADHFEQLSGAALSGGGLEMYQAAYDAYTGELLPEDRYEDWAVTRRSELAEVYRKMLLGLSGELEARGLFEGAADYLRQVLEQDPLDEEVRRRLMRVYAAGGSRHQALRQYQLCRDVLEQELGTRPEPETEALHEAIRDGRLGVPSQVALSLPNREPATLPHTIQRRIGHPLVGRRRVLDILCNALQTADEGQGHLVFLSGETGVGKSRLAAELAREAADRGAVVLWGASHAPESIFPYAAFVEALEGHVVNLPPAERTSLAEHYPELSRLVPSLGLRRPPAEQEESDGLPAVLFAAITRLLADLAAGRLLVVVLDDVHAADPASLQLLLHLARLAAHHRWLLVTTYREEDVDAGSEFQRLASSLVREEMAMHVTLGRLAPEDAHQLVKTLLPEGEVDPAALHRLYALSLGNPLFLREMVQAMRTDATLAQVDGIWYVMPALGATIPRQIQDLVQGRLNALSEETRRALGIIATAGMECSFSLLAEAFSLDEGALLDALDSALEAGIIDEDGDHYAFRHPLFREALYEQLSSGRRTYFHGALAQAIERHRREDVEALAYHFQRSTNKDKAARYLELAGDRARSLYANESAHDYYQELVHCLQALKRPLDLARVYEKLGAVLTTMAWYEEALEVLDTALETYQTAGDRAGMARAAALIGRVHLPRGTLEQGIVRLRTVLEQIDALPPESVSEQDKTPDLADLWVRLGRLLFSARRYRESLEVAGRAIALANAANASAVLSRAESLRSTVLLMARHGSETTPAGEEAVRLAESGQSTESQCWALLTAGTSALVMGELQRGHEYFERLQELANVTGDPAWVGLARAAVGHVCFHQGDWSRAGELLRQGLETLQGAGASGFALHPPLWLAQLCLAQGDAQSALRYAEECLSLAEPHHDARAAQIAHGLLAEHDLLEGRPELALTRLEPNGECAGDEEPLPLSVAPILAQAYLEMGQNERSRDLVERTVERCVSDGDRLHLPEALRVQALALAAEGRADEAKAALDEGLSEVQRIAIPFGEGRLLTTYGMVNARDGVNRLARRQLEEALAIFKRLGAEPSVLQVAQELEALP